MSAAHDIPGWSHPGEFEALAKWASKCPGPWVEIGSYCGRSTVALGEAAREIGVTVFAVDPHQGNPEMAEGQACHHPEVWAREHGSLSVLMDTLKERKLCGTVVPVVGKSLQFAKVIRHAGFVFIDGCHEHPEVSYDFFAWAALLEPDGMIALHDAEHGPPAEVVTEAIEDGWSLVDSVGSLRVLKR